MARGGSTTGAVSRTIDLRGNGSPAYGAVLADPSGRRAARLRRVGLAIAVLFLLWLFGLVLAGLGLLPVSDLPLGRVLNGAPQPPALHATPKPDAPSPADLVPARPATRAPHRASGVATATPAVPQRRTPARHGGG